MFESKCYTKKSDEKLGMFSSWLDEGMFLGYLSRSRRYMCYNERLHKILDCIDVKFDEEFPDKRKNTSFINTLYHHHGNEENEVQDEESKKVKTHSKGPSRHVQKNQPESQIVGDKSEGVQTRRQLADETHQTQIVLFSNTKPRNFEEASKESHLIDAMNEELDWIENNKTWELTPRPVGKNAISTKWVFKNKMNEQGKIIRNKERLVCKGYSQIEGVEYEETFAPMTLLEASP